MRSTARRFKRKINVNIANFKKEIINRNYISSFNLFVQYFFDTTHGRAPKFVWTVQELEQLSTY